MRRSVLQQFAHADISVSIVWIHMLPGDSEGTAKSSAQTIDDPRVRHFHDPERRSGKAVADGLGWEGTLAWDIYLFYGKGSRWTEGPPTPVDLIHQLAWEPTHFRSGDDLVLALREAMRKLTTVKPADERGNEDADEATADSHRA